MSAETIQARQPGALPLATAGIAVVGVCFGMARYGYGLLLPDIRTDYHLGPAALGVIGSGSYGAYLLAAAFTGSFAARLGARLTASVAGLLAAIGMATAGLSHSAGVLTVGILIGGASAGFAFPPFADAARGLAPRVRSRLLGAINCGTGYGVALAAPLAIATGTAWRHAWLAYAAVALLATGWAAWVLPGRGDAAEAAGPPAYGWSGACCRRSLPLLASGVLVGVGSSAYWTFAVEYLTDAGSLSAATSRTFLGVVGVASVLGTGTGDLAHRFGPRRTYLVVTFAESAALALLAVLPGSLTAAFCSGVLFGAAYNAAVGVQVLWSTHLFSARPSLGLSATMGANGLGLLVGPLAAGLLIGPLGLGAVLLLGALLVAGASLLSPPQGILGTAPA